MALKMSIEEINTRWNDFYNSPQRKFMLDGINYYNGKNDITLPENGRYNTSLNEKNFADTKPEKILADKRVAHNFLKFIINQQIAYGIARPFNITTNTVEEQDIDNAESSKERFNAFRNLITKKFINNRYDVFINACINAVKESIGWLYVYYNEKGELDFMNMNPIELCPVWKDDKQEILQGMIRKYEKREYSQLKDQCVSKLRTYIEYYDKDFMYKYKINLENEKQVDSEEKIPYITSKNMFGIVKTYGFEELPFIPIRYNSEMHSLLQEIKPQIDAYDKIQSENVDNVINTANSYTFISGLDGTNKEEVQEFVNNTKVHRMMFAPEGGDAKPILVPLNIAESELTLTRLRKDIFEIGGGVDTQNRDLKDTSGVALRWAYSNIEEKFNIFSTQISKTIRKIITFIINDNVFNGNEDYSDIDYDIIYDTDFIINETETINNLVLSKGLISPETIAEYHPYTKNAQKEYEGMIRHMEFVESLDNATDDTHNNQEAILAKRNQSNVSDV